MKYNGPYDSKPVVGKEAEKLLHAIRSGGSVTNDAAKETIARIVEKVKDPAYVLDKKRKALELAQKEYDKALLAYISSLPSEPDEEGGCFAYSKDF